MALKPPTEAVRAWFYRIVLAVQPLVIAYGVTTSEKAALWAAVIGTVLATGLATANTSTKS